ncbi:hypothetical protein G9A89_004123 [Geosiphon pyriformis]|nr:hypothetical protein G9A89_004123 [Geosiphon pyriformis]
MEILVCFAILPELAPEITHTDSKCYGLSQVMAYHRLWVISVWVISGLTSCRGIKVDSCKTNECGFIYDRFWMIVDEDSNFLTQREIPKLALIAPTINEERGALILCAPGMLEFSLPLRPDPESYNLQKSLVCEGYYDAYDCGEEASRWISKYLGIPSRIVFKSPNEVRPVKEHAPNQEEVGYQPQTAFSDGYPFLLISEESLKDLNSKLSEPVSMRNFRPNITVKGCKVPFEEDTWKKIVIGEDPENVFYVACRCSRCIIPNVNPDTGERNGIDPLKTLLSYRRVDKGVKYKACFGEKFKDDSKNVVFTCNFLITSLVGMNIIQGKPGKALHLRDAVQVIATGEHIR